MAFKAGFPGRCVICGEPIYKGDMICGKTRAYAHVECARQQAQAEEAPAAAAAPVEDYADKCHREWLEYCELYKDEPPAF